MAEVASAPNPNQQVPLDTIPISPVDNAGEKTSSSSNDAAQDGEIRTVFHDPENFNVKHPLMNVWTLWFTKPPSGKAWHTHMQKRPDFANSRRAITGTNS